MIPHENPEALELHPLCAMFPKMAAAELKALADDISETGLRDRIVLLEDEEGEYQVLDGQNRLAAIIEHGMADVLQEEDFEVFDGPDPLCYVMSRNLNRRHLTTSQRSMVAAALTRYTEDPVGPGANLPPAKVKAAAEQLAVSPRTVQHARRVEELGAPELKAAVVQGGLAVSAAAQLAELSVEEQREALAAGPGAAAQKAKGLQAEKRGANLHPTPKKKAAAPASTRPNWDALSLEECRGQAKELQGAHQQRLRELMQERTTNQELRRQIDESKTTIARLTEERNTARTRMFQAQDKLEQAEKDYRRMKGLYTEQKARPSKLKGVMDLVRTRQKLAQGVAAKELGFLVEAMDELVACE